MRRRPIGLQRHDQLPDCCLVSRRHVNGRYRTADRRRDFDHRLVGLEFQNGLFSSNLITHRDQYLDDVPRLDTLAELRKSKRKRCHTALSPYLCGQDLDDLGALNGPFSIPLVFTDH